MTVDGHTLYFTYDAAGTPLTVSCDGTLYYYITNIQGDAITIIDTAGTQVTSYIYDAWGNILSTTGTQATAIGRYNPLRYRGYVYDTETGLYYLQSRYYNPKVGRFINADVYVSTGQGFTGNNMFAYCLNNPVNFVDRDGKNPEAIACVLGVAIEVGAYLLIAHLFAKLIVTIADWIMSTIDSYSYTYSSSVEKYVPEILHPTPSTTITNQITVPSTIHHPPRIIEVATKGRERVLDTGLRDIPDEIIAQNARDKQIPPSERKRYQKVEKARGYRNKQKRQMKYIIPEGGFHLGLF